MVRSRGGVLSPDRKAGNRRRFAIFATVAAQKARHFAAGSSGRNQTNLQQHWKIVFDAHHTLANF
jgi:hypothetical protein